MRSVEVEIVLESVSELMDDLASATDDPSYLLGPKADLGAFWSSCEGQTGEASALGLT
tara:strand:- start:95 stop:268 length:174 start_codon:yes stop_codon:yes gene_type:complete